VVLTVSAAVVVKARLASVSAPLASATAVRAVNLPSRSPHQRKIVLVACLKNVPVVRPVRQKQLALVILVPVATTVTLSQPLLTVAASVLPLVGSASAAMPVNQEEFVLVTLAAAALTALGQRLLWLKLEVAVVGLRLSLLRKNLLQQLVDAVAGNNASNIHISIASRLSITE
jgi:hypothetical protein